MNDDNNKQIKENTTAATEAYNGFDRLKNIAPDVLEVVIDYVATDGPSLMQFILTSLPLQ